MPMFPTFQTEVSNDFGKSLFNIIKHPDIWPVNLLRRFEIFANGTSQGKWKHQPTQKTTLIKQTWVKFNQINHLPKMLIKKHILNFSHPPGLLELLVMPFFMACWVGSQGGVPWDPAEWWPLMFEFYRIFFVHGCFSCFFTCYESFWRNMFDCYWMSLMDFNHFWYCILKCLECVAYSAFMLDIKCAKTKRVWHDCQSYMPFCMKRKWWIILYLPCFLEWIMMFDRQLERRCLHFFGRQKHVICGGDIPWFTNWDDWNRGKLHARVWTELIL